MDQSGCLEPRTPNPESSPDECVVIWLGFVVEMKCQRIEASHLTKFDPSIYINKQARRDLDTLDHPSTVLSPVSCAREVTSPTTMVSFSRVRDGHVI